MNFPSTHVCIIDEHTIVRKAMCQLIQSFGGFTIVADAANTTELFEQLAPTNEEPSICILHINLTGANGYVTFSEIKTQMPHVKIIIISTLKEDYALYAFLRNGANAYLPANCTDNELHNALEQVCDHAFYISQIEHNIYKALPPKICNREMEFLSFCCSELTYKEISSKMVISTRTVETYRDALFEKLQVHSRIGLAMYALRTGISNLHHSQTIPTSQMLL